MKSVAFALALGLVLALSTPAVAAHIPFATLTVDGGDPITAPVELTQEGGILDQWLQEDPGEWRGAERGDVPEWKEILHFG